MITGWTAIGKKSVSSDKRFVIVRARRGYTLIDLDTYNEYNKASIAEAKVKAFDLSLKGRRR